MKSKEDFQKKPDTGYTNLSPAKQKLLEKWLKGDVYKETAGIPRRPTESQVPLSYAQQRQLFPELLERGTAVNNLSACLELQGKLDLDALQKSADQIVARHETLRMSFPPCQGMPAPVIADQAEIDIPVTDFSHLDAEDRMQAAIGKAGEEVLRPVDITRAPLIRIRLYTLQPEISLLLVIVHHIIGDGWSLGVFLRELMRSYQNHALGQNLPLPELPVHYSDYAWWQGQAQRESEWAPALAYWKDRLSGELPVLDLPADFPRSSRQTYAGGTHRFVLPADLTASLIQVGRQEEATLFMTLLSAFYILLHRYSGQDEIIVGSPVANRSYPELERLIGVFINTLVLKATLSGNPDFRSFLRQVRNLCLEAYAHQDLPFEKIIEAIRPRRIPGRSPFFQVVFNMQNAPRPKLGMAGLDIRFVDIDRGVSQFDITCMLTPHQGEWHGVIEYQSDLFLPETITRMTRAYVRILKAVAAHPDLPIAEYPVIPEEDFERMVIDFNRTERDYPAEKCIHELILEQARKTPGRTAVRFEEKAITYHELSGRIRRMAAVLRASGIRRGDRVGVFMERSMEIPEVFLAILESGAVFVPIHISFPKERVHFILGDAEVKVLVINRTSDAADLDMFHGKVINYGDLQAETGDLPTGDVLHVSPTDPAYVIYTSGSTGRPKGVIVHHRAAVNFLFSMKDAPGLNPDDVFFSISSITFDLIIHELCLPLMTGATLVIANKEMKQNPLALARAVDAYKPTVMQATPVVWKLLLDTGWQGDGKIKALCGGDVLSRVLADRLLDRVGELWNMYGPTETTVWSSVCQIERDGKPVSIGRPIGNAQMYVLDQFGKPVPAGVAGELCIGGSGVSLGYLNQPELTREKFVRDPFRETDSGLIYRTGDRAKFLADGSLRLLGRSDDQVKIQANRVEPGEIASILGQHPSLKQAFVLPHREDGGVYKLVAYVVPQPGSEADHNALRTYMRDKLPGYMVPSFFVSMGAFPLLPNGKVDRNALPVPGAIHERSGYVAPRNHVEKVLESIWQEVLGVGQIGIHDNFFDLGGASLQSLEIVAKANMHGLPVTVEGLFEFQTIAELAGQFTDGT